MRSMLDALFTRRAGLSELERLILAEAESCLRPDIAGLWRRQVGAINDVIRSPGGGSIRLRCVRRGRPVVDPALAWPNRREDCHLVTVVLQVEGGFSPVQARICSTQGYLSAIIYQGDAVYLEQLSKMRQAFDITIESHLVQDPALA